MAAKPYRVFLDENFSLTEIDMPELAGRFARLDQALAHCRSLMESDLRAMLRPDMSAQDLFECWIQFGDSPRIEGQDFDAESCARSLCPKLCAERDQPKGPV